MDLPGNEQRVKVSVTAFGIAAGLVKSGDYTLSPGAAVKDVLAKAGLDENAPGLVLMIGGEKVSPLTKLREGDEVKVFMLAGGG